MRRSRPADEPVLITSAPESNEDEYDRRRKKYAIMMTLRAVAVIAAASTYRVSIWLAMAFVVAGTVLPWCAVIIANDRPAKKRERRPVRPGSGNTERALPAGTDDRVVDG
jgi:Flp pilus assembly protein TadB